MTQAQALKLAREKFGSDATVEIDAAHFYPRMRYVHPSGSWSTCTTGQGRNWDSAFTEANYKENKRLGVWS